MTGSADPGRGPDAVLTQIAQCGLIVVIRSPTADEALHIGRVLLGAGVQVLEVTGTTPDACGVLTALRGEAQARVLLGIGSIRSVDDVRRADDVGADFLVSPGSPAQLIEGMLATGRLTLPGVFTSTEVMHAHALGARAVKLFPASRIGPDGLRALRGPFPDVAFVPTGGIRPEDVSHWLEAGALAVGVGGQLAPATLLGDTEATALAVRVRDVLANLSSRSDN